MDNQRKDEGNTKEIAEIEGISTRRVNQIYGKIERFYGTLETKMRYFDTIDKLEWYNCKRPHMSLTLDELGTYQAFLRKLPPERVLGYVWRLFDGGK